MKKILLIIIILMLTSCKKYTELNNLAIIKSIGIEHKDSYNLYALIIDEIDKDNNPKTKIIEVNRNVINRGDVGYNDVKIELDKSINKDIVISYIFYKDNKLIDIFRIIYERWFYCDLEYSVI